MKNETSYNYRRHIKLIFTNIVPQNEIAAEIEKGKTAFLKILCQMETIFGTTVITIKEWRNPVLTCRAMVRYNI